MTDVLSGKVAEYAIFINDWDPVVALNFTLTGHGEFWLWFGDGDMGAWFVGVPEREQWWPVALAEPLLSMVRHEAPVWLRVDRYGDVYHWFFYSGAEQAGTADLEPQVPREELGHLQVAAPEEGQPATDAVVRVREIQNRMRSLNPRRRPVS